MFHQPSALFITPAVKYIYIHHLINFWMNRWHHTYFFVNPGFCIGIFHSLSFGILVSWRITLLFLIANIVVLFSSTSQSSLHNWPSNINDELVNFGNIITVFAAFVNSEDSGNCP